MLLLLFVIASAYAQAPAVNTSQGVIIGSYGNNGFMAFYGIHYAGSTSGANRFKAPTPPPVYPGDYHAVDNSVICAQPTPNGLVGVEDCLVLDVHTRNLTASNPVLVWLEGENYETTSTTKYSFDNLVKENLVVVSINYRLSIFGFLCLGVPEAPGNAGLKDVVQGLKWIRQNIAGFGGDPDNIVLLGHGSGAAMADLITLSPMANGLVHKAIILSGSGLAPWAVAYDPIGYAQSLGALLGYTGKTNDKLASLLATTELSVLSSALTRFEFYNNTPLFAPCIENAQLNPKDTFLSDAPINVIRSGNFSHIPYMAGFTDREGTLRAGEAAFQNWLQKMERNFTEFIQADLEFESISNKTAVAQTVREFYFAKREINMGTIEDYLNYQGDTLILVSIMKGARERALTSTAGVRLFQFAHRGSRNSDWAYPQIPLLGVRHGGILNYLFDFDLVNSQRPRDQLTSRVAIFARTGTQGGYPNWTMWEPISNSVLHMLLIGGSELAPNVTLYKEEARANPHQEITGFWNDIYDKHYRVPRPVSSANCVFSFAFIVFIAPLLTKLL